MLAHAVVEHIAALPGLALIIGDKHHGRMTPCWNDLLSHEHQASAARLDQRVDAATPRLVEEDRSFPCPAIIETATHIGGQHEVLPVGGLLAPVPRLRRFHLGTVHPGGDDEATLGFQQCPLVAHIELRRLSEERRLGPRLPLVHAAERTLRVDAQHAAVRCGDERALMREGQSLRLRMQRRRFRIRRRGLHETEHEKRESVFHRAVLRGEEAGSGRQVARRIPCAHSTGT